MEEIKMCNGVDGFYIHKGNRMIKSLVTALSKT
jgi:hypothetical protein